MRNTIRRDDIIALRFAVWWWLINSNCCRASFARDKSRMRRCLRQPESLCFVSEWANVFAIVISRGECGCRNSNPQYWGRMGWTCDELPWEVSSLFKGLIENARLLQTVFGSLTAVRMLRMKVQSDRCRRRRSCGTLQLLCPMIRLACWQCIGVVSYRRSVLEDVDFDLFSTPRQCFCMI